MLVLSWLSGQLVHALILLGAVAGLDVLLGIILAFAGRAFDLRKIADFVVTTVGFQKTIAFAAAVLVMLLNQQTVTEAVVATMAGAYAATVLPDVYEKLAAVLLKVGVPQLPGTQKVTA